MQTTALQAVTAVVLAVPLPALAGQLPPNTAPTGGAVAAGQVSFAATSVKTTITQASQNGVINWQTYNVGAQYTVQYQQPNSTATTLNRVIGPDPSTIAGHIEANGRVVLVNQAGVFFSEGAVVNTAGLVVSAAGISNSNFMAGRMAFDQAPKPGAQIVNHGTITIKEQGLAALVAPRVVNSGVIRANMGTVILAGAETHTLDLYGDGLVSINVTKQVATAPDGTRALVTNDGLVVANGGKVVMTAEAVDGVVQTLVNAGGRIVADTVNTRTGGQVGQVLISGRGGDVIMAGTVSAAGKAPGQSGGSVAVNTTGTVALAPAAAINASGQAGGGSVAIGTTLARATGGPSVKYQATAKAVGIAKGATIRADALGMGKGGQVTVLSTDNTVMAGTITARGGANGGDGGFVEVSGDAGYALTGVVDVSAQHGALGSILLDPLNLTIVNPGTIIPDDASVGTNNAAPPAQVDYGTLPGADAVITPASFDTLTGNIQLRATQDLTVAAPITLTTRNQALTLEAGNNLTIQFGGAISTAGNITLSASAASAIGQKGATTSGTLLIQDAVTTTAGTIALSSGSGGILIRHLVSGPTVSLASTGGVTEAGGSAGMISTANLISNGMTGSVVLTNNNTIGSIGSFSATGATSDFNLTNSGSLAVTGPLTAGRDIILNVGTAGAGAFTATGSIGAGRTLAVTSGSGGIALNTGAVLTGPAIVLNGASGGIALTGNAALGDVSTALIDLTTIGVGVTEEPTAAISAATLQSTGNITGPASLRGTGNTIGTIASLAVAGANNDFLLIDAAPTLKVTGALTATQDVTLTATGTVSVTATGSIGAARTLAVVSGPGGIALNTGAVLTGPVISLDGNLGTIDLNGVVNASGTLALGAGVLGITQSAGAINAGTLLSIGHIGGPVSLLGTNTIAVIGSFDAGGTTLRQTGTLGIDGIMGNTAANLDLAAGSISITPRGVLEASALKLTTTSGGIQEASGGTVIANSLSISSAVAGDVSLTSVGNTIAAITGISVANGDFAIVADPQTLVVTGAVTANNIMIQAFGTAAGDGVLQLGSLANGATLTATAVSNPRISLVADQIINGTGTNVIQTTASNGTLELAPFTAGAAVSLGGVSSSYPLALLNTANIGPNIGTVVVGRYTDAVNGGTINVSAGVLDVPGTFAAPNLVLNAGSVHIGGNITAGTLLALGATSNGIAQDAVSVLTAPTLQSVGTITGGGSVVAGGSVTGTVDLAGTANNIGTLETFRVAGGGDFNLRNAGALTVASTHTVSADNVTITAGTLFQNGTISGAFGVSETATIGDIQHLGTSTAGTTAVLAAPIGSIGQGGLVSAGGILEQAGAAISHTGTSTAGTGGATLTAGTSITQAGGLIEAAGGNVGLTAGRSILQNAGTIQTTGSGSIALRSNGTAIGQGITQLAPGVIQTGGFATTISLTAADLISLMGTIQAGGSTAAAAAASNGAVSITAGGTEFAIGTTGTALAQSGIVSGGGVSETAGYGDLIMLTSAAPGAPPAPIVTAGAGGIVLTASDGAVIQNAGIVQNLNTGAVTLTANAVNNTKDGGTITLDGPSSVISAVDGNVALTADASIRQNAGTIQTTGSGSVALRSNGTASSQGITQLAPGLIQTTSTAGATGIGLTALNVINQAGTILAGPPGNLGAVTIVAGGTQYVIPGPAVTAGNALTQSGIITGGTVSEFAAAGDITVQSAVVTADAGGLTITAGNGSIVQQAGTLQAMNTGTVALSALHNTSDSTSGTITLNSGLISAVDGNISLVAGGAPLAIPTAQGLIQQNAGTIQTTGGGSIFLTANGTNVSQGITQLAPGLIQATASSVTLTAANLIDQAGTISAGNAASITANGTQYISGGVISAGSALTQTGLITGGTSLSETTTKGDIAFSGQSSAGSGGLTMTANDGSIVQTGGSITTSIGGAIGITATRQADNATSGSINQTAGSMTSDGSLTATADLAFSQSVGASISAVTGAAIIGRTGALIQGGTVNGGRAASLTAGTDLSQSGTIIASDTVTLVSVGGTLSQPGAINGGLDGTLAAATLSAGTDLSQSGNITVGNSATLTSGATLSQSGILNGGSVVGLTARTALSQSGTITASDTATLASNAGTLNQSGVINGGAGGTLASASLTAGTDLNQSGNITVGNSATLASGGVLAQSGVVNGGTTASLTAGTDLSQSGTITASGNAILVSKVGTLSQSGMINGGVGGTLTSASLTAGSDLTQAFSGVITTGANASLSSDKGALNQGGLVNGGTSASLTAGTALSQLGTITATGTATLVSNTGTLSQSGVINGGVGGTLASASLTAGTDLNQSGNITVGNSATLASGATLSQSGVVNGGATASLTAGTTLSQSGTVSATKTASLKADSDLTQAASGVIAAGSSANLSSDKGALNQGGIVNGGTSASLTAGTALSQLGTVTATRSATLVSNTGTLSQSGVINGGVGGTLASTSLTAGQGLTQTGTITSATIAATATAGDVQAMGTTNGGAVTFTAPDGTAVIGGTLNELNHSSLLPNNSIKPAFPNLDTSTAGLLVSGQTVHVLASTLVPTGTPDIVFAILGRGNLAFDGLNAPNARLFLGLGLGTVSGNINVAALQVQYGRPDGNSNLINLTGSVAGLHGSAAATASFIQPLPKNNYLLNGCPIQSFNCIRISTLNVPVLNPLRDVLPAQPPPPADYLGLPDVAERDY